MSKSPGDDRPGLLSRLKNVGAKKSGDAWAVPRAGKRVQLPIPVALKIGKGEFEARRLRDGSPVGLCIDGDVVGKRGDVATVRFHGYPDVCEPFDLTCHVVRVIEGELPGIAVKIDREDTSSAALRHYRKLVLHYLEHRPLLDELDKGYFEGKCEACGWIGRVGERNPVCSRCGGAVKQIQGL